MAEQKEPALPVPTLAVELKETIQHRGKPFKPSKQLKVIDTDISRLANRIQHLKHEISKSKKHITETSTRVKVIKKQKAFCQRKKDQKSKFLSNLAGSTIQQRELIHKRQEDAKDRRKRIQEERQEKLKQEALELRRRRNEIKEKKKQVLRETRMDTANKVKQAKISMLRRKQEQKTREEQEEKRKLEKAKVLYNEKVKDYNKVQVQLRRLEETELEWIDKLNQLQQQQKQAYDRLEAALSKTVSQ